MRKTAFFLIVNLVVKYSFAQVGAPLAFKEYDRGLNPVDEIPLFDLSEIRQRKIDSAFIIYHPASWAEYHPGLNPCTCPYSDTLELYVFDKGGHIIQKTSFQQLGDYSTTFNFDSLGNALSRIMHERKNGKSKRYMFPYKLPDTTEFKKIVKREKEGSDSIITEIVFWKFIKGMDTAYTLIKRFDAKARLIETQSSVNKKNAREFDDDTGEMTYHLKYKYDSVGRLIHYQSMFSDSYKIISYPFYGKLTETYSIKTNQLTHRDIKMIAEDFEAIAIAFNNKQIFLTRLEKGSNLFKLKTVVTPGEFPLMEYYEIVYK